MTDVCSRADNKMGTVTILLVLLCLFQGSEHLRIQGPTIQKGIMQKVKLECTGDSGDSMEHGLFWFRLKKNERNPEGIVFISIVGKSLYSDHKQANNFKPDKSGSSYSLTINSFGDKDQGTYYCMINKNSMLTFSPGLQLFYPEVTTPKPTTTKPTPTTSAQDLEDKCICKTGKKDSSNTKTEFLKIDCDIYIWAPLAGLCAFLLICLLITSIMLCCRTRRRRCRCKHKPLEERNCQMNLMNKHKK